MGSGVAPDPIAWARMARERALPVELDPGCLTTVVHAVGTDRVENELAVRGSPIAKRLSAGCVARHLGKESWREVFHVLREFALSQPIPLERARDERLVHQGLDLRKPPLGFLADHPQLGHHEGHEERVHDRGEARLSAPFPGTVDHVERAEHPVRQHFVLIEPAKGIEPSDDKEPELLDEILGFATKRVELVRPPGCELPDIMNIVHPHGRFASEDHGPFRQEIQLGEALLKRGKLRLSPLVTRQAFPHGLKRVGEHRVTERDMGMKPGFVPGRVRQSEGQFHVGKRGCDLPIVQPGHGAETKHLGHIPENPLSVALCEVTELVCVRIPGQRPFGGGACELIQNRVELAQCEQDVTYGRLRFRGHRKLRFDGLGNKAVRPDGIVWFLIGKAEISLPSREVRELLSCPACLRPLQNT